MRHPHWRPSQRAAKRAARDPNDGRDGRATATPSSFLRDGLASTRLVLLGVAVAPSTPATETLVATIVPQAAVTSRISVVTLAGATTPQAEFT